MGLDFAILGPLEVRSGGEPLRIGGPKARVLLAALLLERNRAVDPERLAAVLWGEDAAHGAVNAVRVQISRLRNVLGRDALITTAAGYQLNVASLDADRFTALAAEARAATPDVAAAKLSEALALWRGPALADLAGESFAQPEIARLEEQRLAALEQRLDADLALGHDVVAECRELVARHPLRERLRGQLMLALYRDGRQADALAVYRATREALSEELGLEPSRELRELERAILNQDPGLAPAAPPAPAFASAPVALVGREAELAAVLADVETARLVLISGEAGIGKSTLARAVASRTRRTVLYGRCDEDPLVPFQPFAEALHSEDLGGALGATERHLLFRAVANALGDRVLLVIDDLHWADAPTLALLRYVLRHTRTVTVLATSREAEPELAVELRRDNGFARLRLEGLDADGTAELIGDASLAADVQARTGGNPFFISQLVQSGDLLTVPEGVKELIATRVAALGPDAGDALRIASAVGADFAVRDPEGLVDRDAAIGALDAAVAAALVVEAGPGRFSFVHALAREAIYEGMSATRRAGLHQRLGEALEPRGNATALAHHFHEGRHVAGPEKAIEWALAAAESARVAYAWEDEVAHRETALALLDEFSSADDALRCRLLLALADRKVPLGGDFRSDARRAGEIGRRHGWADVLADAALHYARVNEYGIVDEGAVALLEEALAALGPEDSARRARVLARLAETLAPDGREPEHRDALSREGLAIARRLGDPVALLTTLCGRCANTKDPDQVIERRHLLDEALALAEAHEQQPDWQFGINEELAGLHAELGDLPTARGYARRFAELVVETRREGTFEHASVLQFDATLAIIDGRFDDAERLARASRDLFAELTDPDADHIFVAQLIPIRIAQGRGAELIDEVAARAWHPAWRAALAWVLASAGRASAARAQMLPVSAIPRLADWLPAVTMLALASAEIGEPAPELAAALAPYADRHPAFVYASAPVGSVRLVLGRLSAL